MAVTSLAIILWLLLCMYMPVRRFTAPRIGKFESRFIATVDVVHNLASLAGLLTYLHTFTHALAHAHRLTVAHIYNRTFTRSHTRILIHTIAT